MPPQWLQVLSVVAIVSGIVCAIIILIDILAGRRQKMAIMNVVWVLTALYASVLGLWAYWRLGRASKNAAQSGSMQDMASMPSMNSPQDPVSTKAMYPGQDMGSMRNMDAMKEMEPKGSDESKPGIESRRGKSRPFWQTVLISTTHCGAGCTLGDVIAEVGIYVTGLVLFGSALLTAYTVDFIFAFAFGILFQFLVIVPMRHLSVGQGLKAAFKADAISLTAFEIGMFAWMGLTRLVLFPNPALNPTSFVFWFMMQIAMLIGFATSYPANWFLVKRGIKEAM